jgi:hypothetical protein
MGDTSPKNIEKLEAQREEEKIEKVELAALNAEAQHHVAPGHAKNTGGTVHTDQGDV